MIIYAALCILLAATYAGLLWAYRIEWNKPILQNEIAAVEQRFLSVVIVTRNEGDKLLTCVQSILSGTYLPGKYEIIIVDDHSQDDSIAKVETLSDNRIKILLLKDCPTLSLGQYKKQGQEYGISKAQSNWIVTTDADCICPSEWLSIINQSLEKNDLVTGPIQMYGGNNWLSEFQLLDIVGTMAGTNYGIQKTYWHSANAANMAFSKSLYQNYQRQHDTRYASGDDMFLIQWAAAIDRPIGFIKEPRAIVQTDAEKDLLSFWTQRLRWASKTKSYQEKGLQYLLSGVWVFNFSILINSLLAIFVNSFFWKLALAQFVIRALADYFLFQSLSDFFDKRVSAINSFALSFCHIIYVGGIGIAAQFTSKYKWKGRTEI